MRVFSDYVSGGVIKIGMCRRGSAVELVACDQSRQPVALSEHWDVTHRGTDALKMEAMGRRDSFKLRADFRPHIQSARHLGSAATPRPVLLCSFRRTAAPPPSRRPSSLAEFRT